MSSPARQHFLRTCAAQQPPPGETAAPAAANAYELMLRKLHADRVRLKSVQSFERKAAVKCEVLPDYAPYIDGVLSGGRGAQDEVLMTVMVWRIDAGDYGGALDIARYALRHGLVMPDQYQRTTGCLIAEEMADAALRSRAGYGEVIDTATVRAVAEITADQDMPDEVRAKLEKVMGYALWDEGRRLEAQQHLRRALGLHEKCGVKKDIERLERELKNSAAGDGASG